MLLSSDIIYVEKKRAHGCNYYTDMIKFLRPGLVVHTLNEHTPPCNAIVVGFSWTDCSDGSPSHLAIPLHLQHVPLFIILNKEYTGLAKKLQWIVSLRPALVFTVHHDTEKYTRQTGIPFSRIMWSSDPSLFRNFGGDYTSDLFFTGVIRAEQTENLRKLIYDRLHCLSQYRLHINAAFYANGRMTGKYNSFSNEEYARHMSASRIALSTTGPADLVGTRYFEIVAGGRALLLCNRMPDEVYSDLFIDGFNCVMFDDADDFCRKCKYYLDHEQERQVIVQRAYKTFHEKQTWTASCGRMMHEISQRCL